MAKILQEDGTIKFRVNGISVTFTPFEDSYVPTDVEDYQIDGFQYDSYDYELVVFTGTWPTTYKGERIIVDYNPLSDSD